MSQTAYWPWPPDCLTCRPWPFDGAAEGLAQRHPDRLGVQLDAAGRAAGPAPRRRAPRPCTTAPAGGSRGCAPAACVGSPATSAAEVLGQRVLVGAGLGHDGDRQQRLGHVPGRRPAAGRPWPRWCRRSRRVPDLVIAQMSPATRSGTSRSVAPSGENRWRDPLVGVVVGVPALGHAVPGRRAPPAPGAACRRRPGPGETRPTYGSMVVLTTSATSGPAGSQLQRRRAGCRRRRSPPAASCSSGDGKRAGQHLRAARRGRRRSPRRPGSPGRTCRGRPPSPGRR